MVTNLFTNPDMVAGSGSVPVFEGLVSPVWRGDPDLVEVENADGTFSYFGTPVEGLSALRGVVVRSSQWSKSGGVSARFITTVEATGNNLPFGIVGVFGSPVGGVVVWRRQDAPIGEFGPPTGDSNLSILTGTGDASAPAVNAPGETLMRVELGEIAPNGVQVYLPGGGNVGDSVWFDILTVTDEPYDGPPFSGATRRGEPGPDGLGWVYSWVGSPNNSVSTRVWDQVLDVAVRVLDDFAAPAVGITVEGLSTTESSRVAIYRQTPGKERTLVQGLGDVTVDGAGYWVDYLPPLGVPITYAVELLEGAWEGVHYEWEGTPNYSVSERIQLGETWRNEYENPTFAGGVGLVTVWENLIPSPRPSYSTARYTTTSAMGVVSGDNYREIELTADVTGETTFYRTQSTNGHDDIAPGETYTGRVGVGNPNAFPVTVRAGFLRTTTAWLALGQTVTPNVTIPAGGYEEIQIGPYEISSTWNIVRVGIVAPDSDTILTGTRLRVYDGVTVTRGEECPHLIHGDMPFGERDPDLRGDWYSQRWSSPSRLAAPSVHGVATSGEVKAIRVSDWGAQGSALRVMTGVPDPFGLEFAGAFAEAVRQYDLEEGPDFEIFHHVGALLPQVMVTCFHGGDMEYGALELGDAVASALGSTWWGIDAHVRPEKVPGSSLPSWDSLHLSSNNYGHPGLLAMLAECDVAVSFHGSRDTGEDIHSPGSGEGVPFSFIGGTNEPFKEAVAASLRRHGFLCDTDVENFPTFPGTNPNNIVHQTRSGSGVQIEMSNAQRRAFFVGGDFTRPNRGNTTSEFDLYVSAVADGVRAFLDGV